MNNMVALTGLIIMSLLCFKGVMPTDYSADEISLLKESTETFVNEVLTCRDLVGMNIAVVKGQQTLFTEGYGYTDFVTKNRPTNETLFGLCSLSKSFTTFSLAKALNKKGFSWKTPMKQMLPDFELSDECRTRTATAEDLASHSMGMDTHHLLRFQKSVKSRKDILKYLKYLPFRKQYRRSNIYNNLMYNVLAYLTEELTGKSWENTLRKDIFKAIGMNSTNFFHEMKIDENMFAHSYRNSLDADGWRNIDFDDHREWGKMGGSASIISNANDMAKWIKLLLNEGFDENGKRHIRKWQLKQIFSAAAMMTYTNSPHIHEKPNIPVTLDFRTYGLGWRMGTYRGYRITSHTGTSLGYGGLITILHEPKIAIYTGITGEDPRYMGRYLVHFHILDQIMKEYPRWPHLSTTCSYNKQFRKVKPSINSSNVEKLSEENLHQYVGTYGNDAYGEVHFFIEDGNLKMNYPNFLVCYLRYNGNATFTAFGCGSHWYLNPTIHFNESSAVKESVTIYLYRKLGISVTFTRDHSSKNISNESISISNLLSFPFIIIQISLLIITFFILKKIKTFIQMKWRCRAMKNSKIS